MAFRINQSLSLVIPRVFPQWVDEQKIIDVFEKQNIGKIYKVSIVRMPNEHYGRRGGKSRHPVYKAYLYFSVWYENEIVHNLQHQIMSRPSRNLQARVVYDDPWHWVVFKNTERTYKLSRNDKRVIRSVRENYYSNLHTQEMVENMNSLFELQQQEITCLKYLYHLPTNFDVDGDYVMTTTSEEDEEEQARETAYASAEAVLMDLGDD